MSERPVLFFPEPTRASKSSRSGGGARPRLISHQRHCERLGEAFGKIELGADGQSAENVLVLEVVGQGADLAKALVKIEGCELLAEEILEALAVDPEFDCGGEETSAGCLYMVFTNQVALRRILRLWKKYRDGGDDVRFESGLAPLRDVFRHLKDIRFWNVEDRLRDTGIEADWSDGLANSPSEMLNAEVELWFHNMEGQRRKTKNEIGDILINCGGKIVKECVIEGIAYHGLLIELTRDTVAKIVDRRDVTLVQCEGIMFVRPVGQIAFDFYDTDQTVQLEPRETQRYEEINQNPIVALLDGLPQFHHAALDGHLIIDDPDDYASTYGAGQHVHGTAMASLIIVGDLESREESLARRIYVRPIMTSDSDREMVPKSELFVDLLHRAVVRIFGTSQIAGEAPMTKIINLSIGDTERQFVSTMSPVARLLDWLSEKYNVLFVVSAGNIVDDMPLPDGYTQFDDSAPAEKEQTVLRYLMNDARNRRLLAPAESINALTVGSLHHDLVRESTFGRLLDVFRQGLPSPISAMGLGYRSSIKPDLVFSGGRQLYSAFGGKLQASKLSSKPGNKVATAGVGAPAQYCRGTSNATALTTRMVALCYESLAGIRGGSGATIPEKCIAPLLKAMIVHGCDWNTSASHLKEVIADIDNKDITRWIGYGVPRIERVLDCAFNRATLLGYGRLSRGGADLFSLPLPDSLAQQAIKRRITVTLAWFSPVNAKNSKYRVANLWVELLGEHKDFVNQRVDACGGANGYHLVRRGTLQHEVFESDQSFVYQDNPALMIKVNCAFDLPSSTVFVSYGIVVSIEAVDALEVPIYEEVREKIRSRVIVEPSTSNAM